jgi:hypothetical protein
LRDPAQTGRDNYLEKSGRNMKTMKMRIAALAILAGGCACALGQTAGGASNTASLANSGFAPRGAHDPKTRTGWTYGPGSAQVQQFLY